MNGAAAGALAFAAALLVCGCQAEMVRARKRVRGPVPEVGWIDPGGGEIRYASSGPAWMVRTRREDALVRVGVYCGGSGKYRVVDELDREKMEPAFTPEDMEDQVRAGGHYRKEGYHYLYFECLP